MLKTPATDPTKGSKAGRQTVVERDGRLVAARADSFDPTTDRLRIVGRDGDLTERTTFDQLRERAWG